VRSRGNRGALWLCVLLLATAPLTATVAQAPATTSSPRALLTQADIDRAVTQLKADPNLGAPRTVRRLKRLNANEPRPEQSMPGWFKWIQQLFSIVASVGRAVLWAIGGILLVIFIVFVVRFVRQRRAAGTDQRFVAPTHVRDMDIRPESLPADIGAAALELWERGEHRAALALLYRGLLSRLAHVHAVPIRDSSTEGECVALAARHLHQERTSYVSRLVTVWQHAVYGGKDPDSQSVRTLCAGFAQALDA
jgi:hypothetical protein